MKEVSMSLQSSDLSVNPASETIRLGPLCLRFLVTGENSSGTVAMFAVVQIHFSGAASKLALWSGEQK